MTEILLLLFILGLCVVIQRQQNDMKRIVKHLMAVKEDSGKFQSEISQLWMYMHEVVDAVSRLGGDSKPDDADLYLRLAAKKLEREQQRKLR